MSDYVISCCSTADLTKEHFEKRNISYICFHYELNGKEYRNVGYAPWKQVIEAADKIY